MRHFYLFYKSRMSVVPNGYVVAHAVVDIPGRGKGIIAKQKIRAGALIWYGGPGVQVSWNEAQVRPARRAGLISQ